jgi:hypothetical protein
MSFSEDIRKFQRKTNLSMDVIVRRAIIQMGGRMVEMSPVDTGRFRGNWMPGIGSPNTSTIEAVDPDGSTTIARITAAFANVRAGGVLYVTNSLPYARRLEYGWSKKAPSPPGIVRATVQSYTAYIASEVRDVQ